MATDTKVVNGKTYYQIGDTWGKVDLSANSECGIHQ